MRRLLFVAVGIFVVMSYASAGDYETPHRFKPGDVISADVMNEIFDYIESSKKTITAADLVGQWRCAKFMSAYPNDSANNNIPPGYQWSKNKFFISIDGIQLNIAANSDGSLNWNSPSRNAMNFIFVNQGSSTDGCAGYGIIESMYDAFAVSSNNCNLQDISFPTYLWGMDVKRISKTRIKIIVANSSNPAMLLCDLQNVPPKSPEIISSSSSGPAIILAWNSNSSDATIFKVLRKDDLNGSFFVIGTTGASSTSYFDVVSAAGTYWYRVVASNGSGDSLGSNVVMIKVERIK